MSKKIVFENKKEKGKYYTVIEKDSERKIVTCYLSKFVKNREWKTAKNNSLYTFANLILITPEEPKKPYYIEVVPAAKKEENNKEG